MKMLMYAIAFCLMGACSHAETIKATAPINKYFKQTISEGNYTCIKKSEECSASSGGDFIGPALCTLQHCKDVGELRVIGQNKEGYLAVCCVRVIR